MFVTILRITAAAGNRLTHLLFAYLFTVSKRYRIAISLRIPSSPFRALRSFRACCAP